MNFNADHSKAQPTEDRAIIPEGLSEEERSASATNRLSRASRERDGEAVDEDTANDTSNPSKKTKHDDDDDDADRSGVAASSSLRRNITTITLAVNEADIPIRTRRLANSSHPNVVNGFPNMDAIVAKVENNAVEYHEIRKTKKPFMHHAELFDQDTGKVIMKLPYESSIGLEKFRELNSFSSRTLTTKALCFRLNRGQSIDGLAIRRVNSPLFHKNVGFVDEDAERLGRQIVTAHAENLEESSHFTKVRLLRPNMDIAERLEMIDGSDHSFFTGLSEEDCDWVNNNMEPIMQLVQDEIRSSSRFLSGQNVLDTPTRKSVDLNEFAAAIVRRLLINEARVFMISGSPRALRRDGGKVRIIRSRYSGSRMKKYAHLTLLRNDPEEGSERHVVSVATRGLVQPELHKLNFMFKMCVNVESIHEQVDCIVNMCE